MSVIMSQYAPLPHSSPAKFAVHEDSLAVSSNFHLALNGDHHFLSPKPGKADERLLDPEAFRRLSISTISSLGRTRSLSPHPNARHAPRTWKETWLDFWDRNQGLFFVTFSQLFGALMNVTTRLLELEGEGMHPFQILFARQGLTVIFCMLWMWKIKVPDFPLGRKEVRGLLVARSLTGFFGIFGMYYSLQYLPVADAVVITFLAPSVASYGCYLWLSEPFPRSAQYASLISLLGVVLIARPTSFFATSPSPATHDSTNSTNPYDFPTPTSSQRLSAIVVALIGVLGAAGAFTSIRWIGNRAHPLMSVNYFSVFCTLISTLALSLAQPLHLSSTLRFQLPANIRQWSMLIFLGVCGFVMQYLLTRGLAAGGRGGGARATNMIYTNMLYALALDRVVFGITPGKWSLAGSALVFGGAVWVAVGKQREAKVVVENGSEDEEMGMLRARGRDENVEDAEVVSVNNGVETQVLEEASDIHRRRE